MVTTFSIGFTGTTLDAILPWADETIGDTDRVVVAMAGSGKDIAYLARHGRTIVSWDPQELSRVVVQGVFAAPESLPEPLERGETFGFTASSRWLREMPDDAALLADHIATQGTDYDRACLAWAIVRSTFQGRLGVWSRGQTGDDLWNRYLRAHQKLARWRGLPGTFVNRKGSVFDDPQFVHIVHNAALYIDTPKVLTKRKAGGDLYSQTFTGLNSTLAQALQYLPPWTEETYWRDMPALWQSGFDRMLLFHVTGVWPAVTDLRLALWRDGLELELEHTWHHKGRTDVCFVADGHERAVQRVVAARGANL